MKKIFFYLATIMFVLFFYSCKKNETQIETLGTGYLETPSNILSAIPVSTPPPSSGGGLPLSYDLSSQMPPVRKQGKQGSCSSWATGYYLKGYQENKENGTGFGQGSDYTGVYSPSFLYNVVKYSDCDNGSYIYKNLDRLKDVGICTWGEMPYNQNDCETSPSSSAINNANCGKIADYGLLYRKSAPSLSSTELINATKEFIANDNPVIIAIPLDSNFYKAIPLTNGKYQYNTYDANKSLGGHAVLAVGYNDSRNAFKVVNSWGTSWGNQGYFWFNYNLYAQIVLEAFTTEDATISCDGGGNNNDNNSGESFGHIKFNNLRTSKRYVHIKKQGAANYSYEDQMVIQANQSGTYYNLDPGIYQYEIDALGLYDSQTMYYSSGQIEVIADSTIVHNIN